jgi:F-type H+-transporting ATPase subunit epsilon
VDHFIGRDESGSFGIRPGRFWLMTSLNYGLASFARQGGETEMFLALPGGVLHFQDNVLSIASRTFFLGDTAEQVRAILARHIATEETRLQHIKTSIQKLDEAMLNRLLKQRNEPWTT